jgi:hypothetical protein
MLLNTDRQFEIAYKIRENNFCIMKTVVRTNCFSPTFVSLEISTETVDVFEREKTVKM